MPRVIKKEIYRQNSLTDHFCPLLNTHPKPELTALLDATGDERELLREVSYAPAENRITLHTGHQTYKLDVRKVAPNELAAICDLFRKMNFDSFDSTIRLTDV